MSRTITNVFIIVVHFCPKVSQYTITFLPKNSLYSPFTAFLTNCPERINLILIGGHFAIIWLPESERKKMAEPDLGHLGSENRTCKMPVEENFSQMML